MPDILTYLQSNLVGDDVISAPERLDESREDGHWGIALHGGHALGPPEAHADEEHGPANERDVDSLRLPTLLSRLPPLVQLLLLAIHQERRTELLQLRNLAQVVEGGVAQVSGHQATHDAPGLAAVLFQVDNATQGGDEGREGLFGNVAVAHDGVVALEV